jgi:Peptidase inhibitor I78 family
MREATMLLPRLCAVMWLVAACQPVPAPDPGRPGGDSLARCGGDPVGALIGQPVSAMPASGGWTVLRVIEPGMAVTQDYSPSRLNVALDLEGRIVGVACG